MGEEVEKLCKGTWKDVGNLRGPVPDFRKYELFEPMEDDDQGLEEGIAEPSEVLGVIHEGNHPRVGLGNDEVVDVKEYGELIHGEVVANRAVHKLAIH